MPAERGGSGRRRGEPEEVSAGGVVLDGACEQVIAIVPRRRAADGSRVLCLPKGHLDPGESALQAAVREVREEAGVEVEHVAELGDVHYWYTRERRPVRKVVFFHLFRYLSGDLADHDEEIEEARWLPLRRAAKELTYDGEREMLTRAIALLGGPHGTRPKATEAGGVSNEREDR